MGQGIFDAVNLILRSWEKTMYGWLMQFWRFWGTLLKDKNKERPRDAPIVQSHPAKLKHEQAHPKYCDNSKPCSKSQSCFEQPFSHKDLLCHPQSPLQNKSLSDQTSYLHPCKKGVSNVPCHPSAKQHCWWFSQPTQKRTKLLARHNTQTESQIETRLRKCGRRSICLKTLSILVVVVICVAVEAT